MSGSGAASQTSDGAAGVLVPVWRSQPGKGRHQVHSAAVGHAGGEGLDIRRGLDQPQPIAQPLNDGAPNKDAAFQRVVGLSIGLPGHCREQLVLRRRRLRADVHEHEAAGSISVFRQSAREAVLPEQGGLLIAGDATDGHGGVKNARNGMAINFAR